MRGYVCVLCVFFIAAKATVPPSPPHPDSNSYANETLQAETKLSETILTIINHYKQPDPIGLPGVPIPDPMILPDMKKSLSVGKMTFKNMKLYGLKDFRIVYVRADVTKMKVEAVLTIDVLTAKGDYTLNSLLSKAHGPFTVKLTKVEVVAEASMEVQVDGILEAQDMDMDLKIKDIEMDFQGMGLLQSVIKSLGSFMFDSIKPFVLREANTNMRGEMNKEIRKFGKTFPNSISPFDQLVYDARSIVRSSGLDPYLVPDYNNSVGIFDVYLTSTWLYGLSSFYRTNDIVIEVRNKTIHALLDIGTGEILGTSNWEVSLVTGFLSKLGSVSFSVEYFKVSVNVSQSMDTSNPPILDDIQLELGNIQIRFDGLGTLDYLVEFGVNVLPNLLRYQIMDAIEKPIIFKIQESLNQINLERLVIENAEQLDSGKGFGEMQFIL